MAAQINSMRLLKSKTMLIALLAVSVGSGCYNFNAAHQDIQAKESELRRMQNELAQEEDRRKALEQDPINK
jgi:hypothetical protein